jgi:hypothetical protein
VGQTQPNTQAAFARPKRQFGFFFYAGLIGIVLLLALGGGYGVWFGSASAHLEAEIAKIQERGEPVWFSDLKPKPVDPQGNGAELYLQAVAQMKDPSPLVTDLLHGTPGMYRGAVPAEGEAPALPTIDQIIAAGGHDEFRKCLDENAQALELARLALQKPYCRFPVDDDTPVPLNILLAHIQKTRNMSWLFQAQVVESLAQGRTDDALAAVQDLLKLSEMLREEPFLVSQLVRMAIGNQPLAALQTVLAHTDRNEQPFAELDQQLTAMEAGFPLRSAVLAERAVLLTTTENLNDLQAGSQLDGLSMLGWSPAAPLRMEDQAFMLDHLSRWADAIDQTGVAGQQRAAALADELRQAPWR